MIGDSVDHPRCGGRCAVVFNGLWRTVQRAIESQEMTVRLIAILITMGACAALFAWLWRT
ncbi:hypothetical protein OG900_16390 [Streptomyces sp. NBC_00433]